MNTPAVNLGTPPANIPPVNSGISGSTPGSFALEISARYVGDHTLNMGSKASAVLTGKKQPGDAGKQEKPSASSPCLYAFTMDDPATHADESQDAPSGEAGETSDTRTCASASTGEAYPVAPQSARAPEITRLGTPQDASGDFPSSPSDSAGAALGPQTHGIPGSLSLSPSISNQVPSEGASEITKRGTPQDASGDFPSSLSDSTGAALVPQTCEIPGSLFPSSSISGQVLADGDTELIPQLDSGQTPTTSPLVADTSSDSPTQTVSSVPSLLAANLEGLVEQPRQANAVKLARETGQNKDANTAPNTRPSAIEITPREAGPSMDVVAAAVKMSDTDQLSGQPSDKTKESGLSGSGKEGASMPGNNVPADPAWTQAGRDSNSTSDGASQDAQENSGADPTALPLKIGSFASVGQKVNPTKSDTSSEIAVDPLESMRRSSDTQKGATAPSTDSMGRAAPTPQNWDGAREHLGQIMSSAHLGDEMGQSELQVDMKSDSWGPLSVRATLSDGQFGAEIQVGNHDAHAALTEGLNTLEKALVNKGIQVANLDVSHGFGSSHSQSQRQQEKQAGQPLHNAKGYTQHTAIMTGSSATSTLADPIEDFISSRVSIRA
jgi:flagellar hook-length control protein FliK